MAEVTISPRAREDLQEIWLSVAFDNPVAADRLVSNIRSRIESLANFPDRGSPRSEIALTARVLIIGNYLIFYEPVASGVIVVRVVHGARSLDDLR